MSSNRSDVLSAAAIARMTNVGRAAVSNWRARYPDFPQPVGGTELRPTFSRAEVEAWLVSTGKADQLATSGYTGTGTRILGHVDPAGASVVDLTAGELLAKVMVSLLPHLGADVLPPGAEAEPGDAADLPVIVDPACADGTLLIAVADRFGDQVRLAGQEMIEAAATLGASRLRGHFSAPLYELHIGDSLRTDWFREYRGTAAAVVCKPPSGRQPLAPVKEADARGEVGIPRPGDAELAWVQHCYSLLRPNGVAVIAVSPRTGVQPSGRRVRAELVRSGALRDVVALPKGMGTAVRSDVCLWVLRRPVGARALRSVRMTDLSGIPDAAEIPQEYEGWQQLRADGGSAACRLVPRSELVDGDAELLPGHHVAGPADVTAGDLERVTERLQGLYALLGTGMPRFGASELQTRRESVTLADLERSGALTILSRGSTPREGDLLLLTMGRPPVVATGTDADDAGIAQVIELDAARLDGYFLATFVWADAASLPVASMVGGLSRDDLRRCRIPRMTIDEQRSYGAAFRRLRGLEEVLNSLAKLSASIVNETVRGLTAGVLSPDSLAAKNHSAPIEGETREL
ncbi:N-6 DNA methylase [Kribbella antibiotica]|uniref:N-6 DNA methylase n=1 Tax=Kribbella antibiotica TaxID=190195 RepID=UPI00192DBF52|nr:N-6 DNA methylase [Kribbella antibiotica]